MASSIDILADRVQRGEKISTVFHGQVETQLMASLTVMEIAAIAHEEENLVRLLGDHGSEPSESQRMMIWQFARLGMAVAMATMNEVVLKCDKKTLKSKVQEQ